MLLATAFGTFALLGAVIVFMSTKGGGNTGAQSAAASVASAASAGASASTVDKDPHHTILVVEVTPTTDRPAQVFVDDSIVGVYAVAIRPTSSHAMTTLPRDGAAHRIRVEAPGFGEQAQWVTADRPSVLLRVTLPALPVSPTSTPTSTPTSAQTNATSPSPPSSGSSVTAPPLDTADPWRH